ncbi:MAG TPA: hypothetical protein VJ650_18340 [Gemmatimonadaceae bacterium]|nr:hypothetical protein [Gemmatimonadaceae bacterium]
MSAIPSLGIPELAGISTYAGAARVGLSVEENVRRLVRYHWIERRLMLIAVSHLPATPEWEVKCGLALHQWLDVGHASAFRTRITEMRNPAPRMDVSPDAALDAFLDELLHARDTIELLAGLYGVAHPALAAAYRSHIDRTNPLVDHPTVRVLRQALADEDEMIGWGTRALEACTTDATDRARADAWMAHLRAFLDAAGGIAGEISPPAPASLAPARGRERFAPDMHPRRDRRFAGQYNFNFPPHLVYNMPEVPADERNLALLCKRTLEMDVPEMMASFIVERAEQPWEFYVDYSRQLWDEARHAMMGTVAFEARGIDWSRIPLNVSFALRLNLHATPLERQTMLYGIEQSLMPADTGKRFEKETAESSGDTLSAHFHDYDWADEVLHAQIGRRWVRREGIEPAEAIERTKAIHERTWAELDRYRDRDPQALWWRDFVQAVLGHESAVRESELGDVKVISE